MTGAQFTLLGLALAVGLVVRRGIADYRVPLSTSYAKDLRSFRSNWSKLRVALAAFVFISAPVGFSWIGLGRAHLPNKFIPGLPLSNFWLQVLCFAGIYAIGALGLNLLIGYTGQISLAQAFFIGVGAYSIGYFGKDLTLFGDKPLPFPVWLTIAVLLGAALSALIGPFALRLRGQYLAVVSIGLVVAGEWLFADVFTWITDGLQGRSDMPAAALTIWPGKTMSFSVIDAPNGDADFFGYTFSKDAAYFWLIWAFVAVCVVVAANLMKTRHGRAMMAVRDRDLSAEIIGVKQAYTKVWAFALCGGMAALAGALYSSYFSFVQPISFNNAYSIQFVAMIIVGGVGTLPGSVLGAIAIALIERLLERYDWVVSWIPVLQTDPAGSGMTLPRFIKILFGVLIITFLMFFPRGLNGLWEKLKHYFRTWPFST